MSGFSSLWCVVMMVRRRGAGEQGKARCPVMMTGLCGGEQDKDARRRVILLLDCFPSGRYGLLPAQGFTVVIGLQQARIFFDQGGWYYMIKTRSRKSLQLEEKHYRGKGKKIQQ